MLLISSQNTCVLLVLLWSQIQTRAPSLEHKLHGSHTQGTHSFHLASVHLLCVPGCCYGWLLSSLPTGPMCFPHQLPFISAVLWNPLLPLLFPFSFFFLFATCKTINELQAEIWDSACNKLMHPFECMRRACSLLQVSFYCALECQPAHSPPELLACALGHPLTLIQWEAPCPSLRAACIRGCTGLLIGPDAHI